MTISPKGRYSPGEIWKAKKQIYWGQNGFLFFPYDLLGALDSLRSAQEIHWNCTLIPYSLAR